MQDKAQQYKELFLAEYGRMYRAAYIMLCDEDDAKDAVQDVFARLWEGAVPLRKETIRTYLLTCIRNRCLNIIAQRQSRQEALKHLTAEDADSGLHDEEIVEAIGRYVDEKLTPQTSRIIRMHYDEEQSYTQISSSLGISLSAVNKHIVQGLRKLRSTFNNREA
ncbi:MAG: sigma-70 family RNA polymerase sigma factor [Prevotella sp.]|nr:sigma-70 family RNA polymerase sigma factor [Prevotella sp.]